MTDAVQDAALRKEAAEEEAKKKLEAEQKKRVKTALWWTFGVSLIVVALIAGRATHWGMHPGTGSSTVTTTTAGTEQSVPARTTCATFVDGDQVCTFGRTRTAWISTGSEAGLQPCFGTPLSTDGPYEAWYMADGQEYHWNGTAEDVARKPAFYSFRAKYTDDFPLHYKLCPAP